MKLFSRVSSLSLFTGIFVIAAVLGVALLKSQNPSAYAAATTLYVNKLSTSCSNTGAGTATQPFCTIGKAATVAHPGQTVQVAAATYAENVKPAFSGTSTARIVYNGAAGAKITGTAAGSDGFTISGKNYITITGFEINNTVGNGITVLSASNHLLISNNRISFAGRSTNTNSIRRGISLEGATASTVRGNTITRNTGPGIHLAAGSNENLIENNNISYNATKVTDASGTYWRLAPGIDVRSNLNSIKNNTSHHNDDSGIQLFSGATGNLVVNNVTYSNVGYPNSQAGDHGIDVSFAPNNRVISNTVYNNRTAGINVEGSATGTKMANNIAVNNGIYGGRTEGNIRVTSTSVSGTTANYEILYNTSGTGVVINWNNISYATVSAMRTATGQESKGLQVDPQWVNAANGNFRLTAGSRAIDSANSSASGQLSFDRMGVTRRDDSGTANTGAGVRPYDDRGAFEY